MGMVEVYDGHHHRRTIVTERHCIRSQARSGPTNSPITAIENAV